MKIKTTKRLFYDEAYGGLIIGEDDWGSNDRCWLYLEKGAIGYGEDIEDEFEFPDNGFQVTTVDPDWCEVIS